MFPVAFGMLQYETFLMAENVNCFVKMITVLNMYASTRCAEQ